MVDTHALPHVVYLITVKWENAQRTETSVNIEKISRLVLHLKTSIQEFRFKTWIDIKIKYEAVFFIRSTITAKINT